jgi:hypothetical protein
MPKALCILGMVVALLLGVFFLADLAVLRMAGGGMTPTMNTIMDIGFILCALMLGYISWSTWREQT